MESRKDSWLEGECCPAEIPALGGRFSSMELPLSLGIWLYSSVLVLSISGGIGDWSLFRPLCIHPGWHLHDANVFLDIPFFLSCFVASCYFYLQLLHYFFLKLAHMLLCMCCFLNNAHYLILQCILNHPGQSGALLWPPLCDNLSPKLTLFKVLKWHLFNP